MSRGSVATSVFSAGFVLWLLSAGGAAGATTPKSEWVSYPSADDYRAVWPEAARKEGIGGRAIMRCHIEDAGDLSGCTVVRETPTGQGFGQAMIGLAPKYRHHPPGANGKRETVTGGDWYEFDTPPDWIRKPTEESILSVYPTAALKNGVQGKATVNCIVSPQGALVDCVIMEESPIGMGFGGAAVAITPQLMMKSATRGGAPTLSVASIPINFRTSGPMGPVPKSRSVAPANLPWADAPTYSDVVAAYPRKAREEMLGGRAALSCKMTVEGRLGSCAVINSEPKGYGFDSAAKVLAHKFRFQVSSEEDRKATKMVAVHLPVTFDPAMIRDPTPVVGKPAWTALPSEAEMRAAFGAVKLKGTLRATLVCKVMPGGVLSECAAEREDPADSGVAAAALKLTSMFRVSTWTAEGLPSVGGTIRIPLRYEAGDPQLPPASK